MWKRMRLRLVVCRDRWARYCFAPILVKLATAILKMGPVLLIVGKCIEVRSMPRNPKFEGSFELTAEFRDTEGLWANVGEGIASRMAGGYFWILVAVAWAAVGVTHAGRLLERSQGWHRLRSRADSVFALMAMILVLAGAGLYLVLSMKEGSGLFMTPYKEWDGLCWKQWPTIERDMKVIFQVRACNGVLYMALACSAIYLLAYQARLIWLLRVTMRSRSARGTGRPAKSLIESLTAPFVGSYSFWVIYSFAAKTLGLPDDPEKILQVFGEFVVFSLPYAVLWLAARSVLRPYFVLHFKPKAFPHVFTVTNISAVRKRGKVMKASKPSVIPLVEPNAVRNAEPT